MGVDRFMSRRWKVRKWARRRRPGLDVWLCTQRNTGTMSLSLVLAQGRKRLAQVRKEGILPYLDLMASQVTVEYDENDKPFRVDTVVVSSQHAEDGQRNTRKDIINEVVLKTIPENLIDENTTFYINPTGRFIIEVMWGPDLPAEK